MAHLLKNISVGLKGIILNEVKYINKPFKTTLTMLKSPKLMQKYTGHSSITLAATGAPTMTET